MELIDNSNFKFEGYTDARVNLKKELADVRIGENLWSPLIGDVKYLGFDNDGNINTMDIVTKKHYKFTTRGHIIIDGKKFGVTCLLSPSHFCLSWRLYQSSRWKANVGEDYWYIDIYGNPRIEQQEDSAKDSLLRYSKNYFKSYDLAIQSPIYKAFKLNIDEIDAVVNNSDNIDKSDDNLS